MTLHNPLPVKCAVELWKASGERTRSRLDSLVEHFATQYQMPDQLETLQAQALQSLPDWMRPTE